MDPRLERQAAYLRKVLPPAPGGAFDVVTGEAFLRPPDREFDDESTRKYARVAFREVFERAVQTDEWLEQLATELPSREEIEKDPTLGTTD